MTGLEYTILYPWQLQSGAGLTFKGLTSEKETLLFSPSSMTELLEKMFGTEVEVRPVVRERRLMDAQSAAYLHVAEGEGAEAAARGVWIMAETRPLIYAFSLIPLQSTAAGLLLALEGDEPEPIGRILNRGGISFIKENLEGGVIRCPFVAEEFCLSESHSFFARRYVLRGEKAGELAIKAAIIEVFSPKLISTKSIDA